MVPEWRITQIRAAASALACVLSDQSLFDLGSGANKSLLEARGDGREELQAMVDSLSAEVVRRGTMQVRSMP